MSKAHHEKAKGYGHKAMTGSGSGAVYSHFGTKRVPATGHTPGDNPKGQDGSKLC